MFHSPQQQSRASHTQRKKASIRKDAARRKDGQGKERAKTARAWSQRKYNPEHMK